MVRHKSKQASGAEARDFVETAEKPCLPDSFYETSLVEKNGRYGLISRFLFFRAGVQSALDSTWLRELRTARPRRS